MDALTGLQSTELTGDLQKALSVESVHISHEMVTNARPFAMTL